VRGDARCEMNLPIRLFFETICKLSMMGFFRKIFTLSVYKTAYFWSIKRKINNKIHLLVKNSISNL